MATRKITQAVNSKPPSTQPDQVGATRQVLQVVSKRDGFRRAGREWHGTTTVLLDDLTDEQLEQLKAEPMLVVLELEVPAEPSAWPSHIDSILDPDPDAGTAADGSQASGTGAHDGAIQA